MRFLIRSRVFTDAEIRALRAAGRIESSHRSRHATRVALRIVLDACARGTSYRSRHATRVVLRTVLDALRAWYFAPFSTRCARGAGNSPREVDIV